MLRAVPPSHAVLDDLSAHEIKRVPAFLDQHRNVHLRFTLTYGSWPNQVENRFANVGRDVIVRGVFKSVSDLRRKLMRYIRHYNKIAKRPVEPIRVDRTARRFPNGELTGEGCQAVADPAARN